MKTYWFAFNEKSEIVVEKKAEGGYRIPFAETVPFAIKSKTITLPELNGCPAKAVSIDGELPSTLEFSGLRDSYVKLPFDEYYAAGKAAELINFHTNIRFCSHCGKEMEKKTDISRVCTGCGREIWAPVQPAIIVLVSRGKDEVLLARAKNFRRPYYGLIAGFVETGESIEETVRREVMEETGLKIKNIRYYKSQPWPYPNNLMLGFFAEYESGEIKVQEEELLDCRWFNRHAMPEIPGKLSMARMLLDEWLSWEI